MWQGREVAISPYEAIITPRAIVAMIPADFQSNLLTPYVQMRR